MKKYTVRTHLDYEHQLLIGVRAETPEDAIKTAQQAVYDGSAYEAFGENSSEDLSLLYDDFEEKTDDTMEFDVVDEQDDEKPWPSPRSSVQALEKKSAAFQAARLLVEAYDRAEARGSSVNWDDIDLAVEYARKAIGKTPEQKAQNTTRSPEEVIGGHPEYFDAVEIHGIQEDEPTDEYQEIQYWSVFLHYAENAPEDGIECVGDFESYSEAMQAASKLAVKLGVKVNDYSPRWYRMTYQCQCGVRWQDEWGCSCDDRCPSCDTPCTPLEVEDITNG